MLLNRRVALKDSYGCLPAGLALRCLKLSAERNLSGLSNCFSVALSFTASLELGFSLEGSLMLYSLKNRSVGRSYSSCLIRLSIMHGLSPFNAPDNCR